MYLFGIAEGVPREEVLSVRCCGGVAERLGMAIGRAIMVAMTADCRWKSTARLKPTHATNRWQCKGNQTSTSEFGRKARWVEAAERLSCGAVATSHDRWGDGVLLRNESRTWSVQELSSKHNALFN